MNNQGVVAERRLFDPEGAKNREFLAARIGGAQGQTARGHAERLIPGDAGAEKARALKLRDHLPLAAVLGAEHAKSGKSHVGQFLGDLERAIVELGLVVGDPLRLSALDDVQFHRRGENPPAMQRLDGEALIFAGPNGRARLHLDI